MKKIFFLRGNKGFTLIEMLVVVAIVGILSATVLTALGPSRDKARDARIISALQQARSIAETLYDGDYEAIPAPNLYGKGDATLTESFADVKNEIIKNNTDAHSGLIIARVANSDTAKATTTAFYALLNVGTYKYYCVSSEGIAKEVQKNSAIGTNNVNTLSTSCD